MSRADQWAARLVVYGVDVATAQLARLRQRALGGRATLAPSCVLHPTARLSLLRADRAAVVVGEHSHVRGELLIGAHGGRIALGRWCYVGEGTRIWSGASISIGDRVLIAHGCDLHDWDAHSLDPARRHAQFQEIALRGHPTVSEDIGAAPIVIGDDVWIGFGSAVMKGVTIGARSVVAARSVVLEDVPPDVLVAGSPARVLRSLTSKLASINDM
jgi:acetyltransferase-like isoleucine patch superfamily enzyme